MKIKHKKRNEYIFLGITIVTIIFCLSCHKPNNPNEPENSGLFTRYITVDGTERRYAIYIPKDISNLNLPLVFALHGGSGKIENMTGESGYKAPYKIWINTADNEKFIVVYPEGLNGASNKPTWNDCRANCTVNSNADDVNFISTLIEKIKNTYNIDSTRIYVTGFSNGGIMSLRLAVELSDKITAVAAISSSLPDVSECEQAVNPVSILFMSGTDDRFLPYNGGIIGNPPNIQHGSVFSIETSVSFWGNINQTDTIPEHYVYPDLDTDDGGVIERFSYKNGIQGTEVILYKINGGGHLVPSKTEQYSSLTEQIFGKQNHDIEMTTEVWNFFKNKTLN